MLYIFKVVDSPFFKFGFTDQVNPWNRIQRGFWTNVHPPELCQKLDPDNFELIFIFEGDERLERVIQSLFPPYAGEFWKEDDLDEIVDMLKLITEEIRIPPRPCFQYTEHVEKLACCTGVLHVCWSCGKQFSRFCKLLQHKRDVHEAARFACICDTKFPRKGNLDRHVAKSCKGKR